MKYKILLLLLVLGFGSVGHAWFDTNAMSRTNFSFQNSSAVLDIPIPIIWNSSNLVNSCIDFRVASSADTAPLAFEVEANTCLTNNRSIFWVRQNSTTTANGTYIYHNYTAPSDFSNKLGTWINYSAVLHNKTLNSVGGAGINATDSGTVSTITDGVFGYGWRTEDTSSRVQISNGWSTTTQNSQNVTAFGWFKANGTAASSIIFALYGAGNACGLYGGQGASNNQFRVYCLMANNTAIIDTFGSPPGATYNAGEWYFVAYQYDGFQFKAWLGFPNGSLELLASTTNRGFLDTTTDAIEIGGADSGFGGTGGTVGSYDEWRIMNINVSTNYIKQVFESQNSILGGTDPFTGSGASNITITTPTNRTYFTSRNFLFSFLGQILNTSNNWTIRAYLDGVLGYENNNTFDNQTNSYTQNLTIPKSYNFTVKLATQNNSAISFNGIGNSFNFSNPYETGFWLNDTTAWSYYLWASFRPGNNSGLNTGILGYQFRSALFYTGDTLKFGFRNATIAGENNLNVYNISLLFGQVTFIGVRFDNATKNLTIFVNDTIQLSRIMTTTNINVTEVVGTLVGCSANAIGGGSGQQCNATLDQLVIYVGRTLTNSEFIAAYRNGTGIPDSQVSTTNLRALINMNEGTGNIAHDTSALGNNISLRNNSGSLFCGDPPSVSCAKWVSPGLAFPTINPETTTNSVFFTIDDYELESDTFTTPAFETQRYNFTSSFRVNFDLIANLTGIFFLNKTIIGAQQTQIVNASNIALRREATMPLIPVNQTSIEHIWQITANYTNNTNNIINQSANNGTLVFGYEPIGVFSDNASYTELQIVTFTASLLKYVNFATVFVNITFNNGNTVTTLTTNTSSLSLFTGQNRTPTISSGIVSFPFNATFYINFNGSTRVVLVANGFLNVSTLNLTDCVGGGDQVLNFTFYNESLRTSTVAGHMNMLFTIWKETTTFSKNFTFNVTDRFTYVFCISPVNQSIRANATIEYDLVNGTNTQRNYFLVNANLSTPVQYVNLYLLDGYLAKIVKITVLDESANTLKDAIVKVQRWYIENNSFIVIAMAKTDFDGIGITRLQANDVWYRFIVEKNGQILQEFQSTKVVPDPITDIAEFTLRIVSTGTGLFFKYNENIGHLCAYNNATDTLTCTVSDTSGTVVASRLSVDRLGINSWTNICDTTIAGVTNTHSCVFGSNTTLNQTYRWILTATTSKSTTILETNFLTFGQQNIYGAMGLFVGMMMVLIFALIGSYNPSVSLAFVGLALILSWASNILVLQISSVISILVVLGIIAWKTRT